MRKNKSDRAFLLNNNQTPWIIGVTGKPGSGKTHALACLIDYLSRNNKSFDGFLSVAEGRENPDVGAARYELHFPVSGLHIPFCSKTEGGNPPYIFSEEAWQLTDMWVQALKANMPCPGTIILDEFGKLEARNQGFAKYWQRIYACGPQIIIISIRDGYQSALESAMGFSFDLVLRAEEPYTVNELIRYTESMDDWQKLGRYGAGAGALEMSLGSVLHASRIPFRGVPLAMLQSLILFFAGNKLKQPFLVIWVSYVAAALKALSPAGNRIRPMLAIITQGSLFGLSVKTIGWNMVGIGFGAWLIGVWAVFQGFVFQYLLYGRALITVFEEVQQWIFNGTGIMIASLPLIVSGIGMSSGVASAGLTLFFFFRKKSPAFIEKLVSDSGISRKSTESKGHKNGLLAKIWFEYRQRAFWLPMILMMVLLLLSGSEVSDISMVLLRASGVLTAIIVVFSFLKPARIVALLRFFGFREAGIVVGRVLR